MITREMKIEEIIRLHPEIIEVLKGFGLDCSACSVAEYEDLEHGAGVHKVNIDELLVCLNKTIS